MKKFRNLLKIFFIFLFNIFLMVIIFGGFFYKAEFCMVKYGDVPMLIRQHPLFLISGISIGLLIYFLLWMIIEKHSSSLIFRNGWLLYSAVIFFQILVVYFFRIKLTADWEVIYRIVQKIIVGDFSEFNRGGYLYAYPHNLGVTLYYTLINILAPTNLYFPRALNIFYSLITFFLINKTFVLINSVNIRYKNHFLIYTLLFIPPVFMINLVYNEVLSTMLFLLGVYFCVKFSKQKNLRLLIFAVFLFSFGNFIRSIGFIFVISAFFYLLLAKINWKTLALFIALAIIGFTAPLHLLNWYLCSSGKISEKLEENSVPVLKWIHIGLNRKYFGYWDQGESYWMYATDASWSKQKANNLYCESIKRKIKEYGVLELVNIYFKKLVWLWTEGTYQSVYLGMSHSAPGGYMKETAVSRFFDQKIENREPIKMVMYFENFVSLLLIFVFVNYIILGRKWNLIKEEMLLILILLMFILFYLFWEVKPRYIYPAYPYILMLSFISGFKFFNLIKMKIKPKLFI